MRALWSWLLLASVAWRPAEAFKGSYINDLEDVDAADLHAAPPHPETERVQELRVDSRGHFVQERKAPHTNSNSEDRASSAVARKPEAAEPKTSGGGSSSSLVTTDAESHESHESHKKAAITWYCDGYCIRCGSGTDWRITRAQPTGRKLAKWFAFGIIASAIAMLGPFLGFAGYLYMGTIAMVGVGSYGFIAGATIGLSHLMVSMHERACPVVGFEEKLSKNRGYFSGLTANIRQVFKKTPPEAKFSLNDLNFQELVLRLEHGNGTKLVKGDRSEIPADKRIGSALACNILTLHSKYWNDEKKSKKSKDAVIKEIVGGCGEWLCGKSKVSSQWKMGWFTGSGCGGLRGSIGNWFR